MANKVVNKTDIKRSVGADFPKHSLESALRVATALEEKNSGNALPPTDVAIALDKSPGSSDFRILLSSSIKYGLTTGSYNNESVALADVGRDVAEPKDADSRTQALLDAAFRPELFRRIYDGYKGKKVPDNAFFQNTLVREYGVAREQAAKCAEVFLENLDFLGLVKQATTGKWIGTNSDVKPRTDAPVAEPTSETDSSAEEKAPAVVLPAEVPSDRRAVIKNSIFVGHGGNRAPLEQLEKFLREYMIPHKVAIDEPNSGRPISQKVADLMNECGAAIIIFTADEEFKTVTGETIFRPSENAIFELGAASVMYGKRVVIFKEAGVTFPTNFRDIGYIEFEKNKLSERVNQLFRELISFGLITVSVAMPGK